MLNVTLCMRVRREIRNFASQKFRLTPVIQPPTLLQNVLFCLLLLTSVVQKVRVCTVDFVPASKNTLLLYVTVCEKIVPRLNKHDYVMEWNFMKIAPPEMKSWLRHCRHQLTPPLWCVQQRFIASPLSAGNAPLCITNSVHSATPFPPPLPTPMNMGHYLWGVQRVKRFVNVHLHCTANNLKKISKMSMLHLPRKNFCRRPCCQDQERWVVESCIFQQGSKTPQKKMFCDTFSSSGEDSLMPVEDMMNSEKSTLR